MFVPSSIPDILHVVSVRPPGHHHAIGVWSRGLQHRHPHDQTVVTPPRPGESAIVCMPPCGDGDLPGGAHHDGVEDAHRGPAQQLRGRRGQRGEVERVTEVVVSSLRPLTQGAVPSECIFLNILRDMRFKPVENGRTIEIGHVTVKCFVLFNVTHCALENIDDVLRDNLMENHGA